MTILFELILICWTFRKKNWYRYFPYIPIPPRNYIEWRIETAYGDKSFKNIRLRDVFAYIRWHRIMRLSQE